MTKIGLLVLAVTVAIIWLFAQTLFAMAQSAAPMCGDAKLIIQNLAKKHHELGFIEFMSDGTKMQLYANPATRSWTWLAYAPGGKVCIVGAGDTFEPMPMAIAETPKGDEL